MKWPTESLSLQAHSCSAQCIKLHTCPQTFLYFTDNYCYLIPEYLDGLDSVGTNWKFFVHPALLSINLVRSLLTTSKIFSFKLQETRESLLTCTLFLKIPKNSLKPILCPPTCYNIKHMRESIFLIVVMPTFNLCKYIGVLNSNEV